MIRSGLVGPKPRPRGVGDGAQVHIPAPLSHRLSPQRATEGWRGLPTGHGGFPLVACPWRKHGRNVRGGARTRKRSERVNPDRREKLWGEGGQRPYRKPTQVGWQDTAKANG
jgi:hypothetical protein